MEVTSENEGVIISPLAFPNKGDVTTPRLDVSIKLTSSKSESDYIDAEIKSCQPGVGCGKYGTEIVGENKYFVYDGPGAVVINHCFIKLNNQLLAKFCDQGFRNDNLRNQILSTFKFLN